MVTKFEGKRLIGTYEVLDSGGDWHRQDVLIESQNEFNKLINICNQYPNTMNLIDIKEEEIPIKKLKEGSVLWYKDLILGTVGMTLEEKYYNCNAAKVIGNYYDYEIVADSLSDELYDELEEILNESEL